MRTLKKSKYYLFLSVIPIVILAGAFKIGIHALNFEIIQKSWLLFSQAF